MVVGFTSAAVTVALAGIAILHDQWVGAAFVVALGGLLAGPAFVVGFFVRLAFDGQRLFYKSASPAVVAKADVKALQLIRFGGMNTFGLPTLRIVDFHGRILMSAGCVWTERQLSEIAKALAVPLERTS